MPDGTAFPDGCARLHRLAEDTRQEYHLFVPFSAQPGAPLVISVHGISRHAEEHLRAFAHLAALYGAILVAPLFPTDRFPDYQRLGRAGRGMRADVMLDRIVDEVGRSVGPTTRPFLIGHSGGAQFVHRYVMAHPAKVQRYVVSAAGWYTLPDPALPFPAGTGRIAELPDLTFDAVAFLAVPGCAFVGSRDIGRGAAVKKSLSVDRDQGMTRLERARRWSAAMNQAALAQGLPGPISFRVLPEAAHRFSGMVRRGGLAEIAFAFLFAATDRQPLMSRQWLENKVYSFDSEVTASHPSGRRPPASSAATLAPAERRR
jgi:pimeloyl-ACP methyl ester carboxylesterase